MRQDNGDNRKVGVLILFQLLGIGVLFWLLVGWLVVGRCL